MDPFIGQLMLVGFNFAPVGWATCEGQLLAIASNTALFSLLGTTYGGDGRTTFGLPDLRGRVPAGRGNGPGLQSINWGQRSGTNTNTLNVTNLPSHNHVANVNVSTANGSKAVAVAGDSIATSGVLSGRTFTQNESFNTSSPNVALANTSVTVGNTGSNVAVNNMQPYLGMYWIIALVGIYPSRS